MKMIIHNLTASDKCKMPRISITEDDGQFIWLNPIDDKATDEIIHILSTKTVDFLTDDILDLRY